MSDKPVTAIVLGCGARGLAYALYAKQHPDQLKIVGAAEPRLDRMEKFIEAACDSDCARFSTWQEALAQERFADCVFVCMLDTMHTEPAVRALEKGYHVLLEKPMSPVEDECRRIVQASERSGRILSVCHVLRYTPFFQTIRRTIDNGLLGDIMSFDQVENVAYWHQAHSFVRGNWRNSEETSPMILQKSCHDLDIILWLMNDRCTHVSSFGSLRHFTPDNAPSGATHRCLDGCPHAETCPYYAPRLYLTDDIGWPTDTITTDLSHEGRVKALQEGPYGRCVYHCDNDVVDHQVVNMEFSHGQTATFTMCGFTSDHGRQLKIMGTKGQLIADTHGSRIWFTDFLTEEKHQIEVKEPADMAGYGHGGGDYAIVRDFVDSIRSGGAGGNLSSASVSLESHLMCFAAERSRLTHSVIDMR